MRRTVLAALSASAVLALAVLAATSFGNTAAETPTSLAVDADPSGNTATSLGPANQCVVVQAGQSFQVDIVVRNVQDLLGWEAYVIYDPAEIQLTDRDVKLFLAANAGSNVFDASDVPANAAGRYRVAAADIADPPVPDSGSGVLARLTFSALSPGVSIITIRRMSGAGQPDTGPILTALGGERIGDSNGDSYFDGPVSDAWIAVDTACPSEPPPLPTLAPFTPSTATAFPQPAQTGTPIVTATPTPAAPSAASADDGGPPWAIIGALSAAVFLLASALLTWRLRTQRAG